MLEIRLWCKSNILHHRKGMLDCVARRKLHSCATRDDGHYCRVALRFYIVIAHQHLGLNEDVAKLLKVSTTVYVLLRQAKSVKQGNVLPAYLLRGNPYFKTRG